MEENESEALEEEYDAIEEDEHSIDVEDDQSKKGNEILSEDLCRRLPILSEK